MMSFSACMTGFFMNLDLLQIVTNYANEKKGGMKFKKNLLLCLVTAAILNGGRGCRTQF
jgi:hypothetical protein